jgi:hypothetical protein
MLSERVMRNEMRGGSVFRQAVCRFPFAHGPAPELSLFPISVTAKTSSQPHLNTKTTHHAVTYTVNHVVSHHTPVPLLIIYNPGPDLFFLVFQ